MNTHTNVAPLVQITEPDFASGYEEAKNPVLPTAHSVLTWVSPSSSCGAEPAHNRDTE
jgi:hypothetical protein